MAEILQEPPEEDTDGERSREKGNKLSDCESSSEKPEQSYPSEDVETSDERTQHRHVRVAGTMGEGKRQWSPHNAKSPSKKFANNRDSREDIYWKCLPFDVPNVGSIYRSHEEPYRNPYSKPRL